MFKMTITAGAQYDRNGRVIADFPQKLRAINKHIAATFGGYTVADTFGGWINGEGQLVEERGTQWQVYMPRVLHGDAAQKIAHDLAALVGAVLNQESVVAEVTAAAAEFVPQPANDNAKAAA